MDITMLLHQDGCNISDTQTKIIKSLPVSRIILAFDEGLSIDHVLKQAEKLKGGLFNQKTIFVIFDGDNKILKKGSKNNACDLGKESFEILMRDYIFIKEQLWENIQT